MAKTRKSEMGVRDAFVAFGLDLLSRKFLLTLAFALTLLANKQYTELVALLVGYLGVQAAGDYLA